MSEFTNFELVIDFCTECEQCGRLHCSCSDEESDSAGPDST